MRLFYRQLKIKDLLDIDKDRIKRSSGMIVKHIYTYNILQESTMLGRLLNMFKSKPHKEFYKVFRYEVKSTSGNTYVVFIKVSPSFSSTKFMNNKIQVFCTCDDFKYRAAYNLNLYGNLFLIPATEKHLGDKPLKIAPKEVSTTPICKHIYAVMNNFKSNIKSNKLIL